MAGGLAIVAALGTTVATVYASTASQQAQFAEERAAEDRMKRTEVYNAFLDSANEYTNATADARECIDTEGFVVTPEVKIPPPGHPCFVATQNMASARFDFSGLRDDVYVYGSAEATALVDPIAETLPISAAAGTIDGVPNLDLPGFREHDPRALNGPYLDFQRRLCIELPALPRDDC